MPRAIWSGSISFALINIPVKLYSAISPKDVHFHQLHDEDGARIQQKRVCAVDGKEVPYEHIVKGYEISPNRYVILKPEELEALDPKARNTIEIKSFVNASEIDPLFVEYSYYLVPDKGADKPYALLLKAMQESGRVAIARTILRTKQYVTELRPLKGSLTLSTLYYYDEVIPQSSLEGLPDANVAVNPKELSMATQLIESLTEKYKPEEYHDTYREELLALIERKSKGEVVESQAPKQEEQKVVSLMAALEASLNKAKKAVQAEPGEASQATKTPAKKPRGTAQHTTHKKRRTA